MKKSSIFNLFICLILICFNLTFVYANNSKSEEKSLQSIYVENEYFKVVYIEGEKNSIMPISSLQVFQKKDNKLLFNNLWSNAVILNNGNLLLVDYNNGKYSYYELDKYGNKNFLIDLNYYIKDIHKSSGNYIILYPEDLENNKFLLGILDKEFKIITEPIFEYSNAKFENGVEILKLKDGKYGLFSIDGKTLIEPIFDKLSYDTNNNIIAINGEKSYTLKMYGNRYLNITTFKNADLWAKESIEKSFLLGFVTDNLQLKLKENITREEFSEILVKIYEKRTGFNIEIKPNNFPFVDTKNEYVLKAYELKIVAGKLKNKFEPNLYITREEAATMFKNLAFAMDIQISENKDLYEDDKDISDWAKKGVYYVSSEKVMNGYGDGKFLPKANYKVQEAISSAYRFFNIK